MDTFYEHDYHIGADLAGLRLQCRPSGMMSLLQEGATQAALDFQGSSPEMYDKYGVLWMVTRAWYRLDRPLLWNETVTIRTWHRADRNVMLYRDYDLLVDGRPVGEGIGVWVLVDEADRRLRRMADFPEIMSSGGGSLCREAKLKHLRLPEDMAPGEPRRFHYSDLDFNGHVNNVRYADLCADAVGLERVLEEKFVSEFQIEYTKECMAGETIDLLTGGSGGTYFIQGVGPGKESRFEAKMTLDNLPG